MFRSLSNWRWCPTVGSHLLYNALRLSHVMFKRNGRNEEDWFKYESFWPIVT